MLKISGNHFVLNDEKFNIYSGAIHYFRILPQYWEDRLLKLKLAGFNTVETYIAWNMHENKEGCFDFSGNNDFIEFINIAKKLGLYVIVRPGPYICAEWDAGGLPAWLFKDKNMRIRCYDKQFLFYVERFFNKLLPLLEPCQISRGGNIIAMQIENEYGSYGNDKKYLKFLVSLFQKNNIDALLFTSDGDINSMQSSGKIEPYLQTANFGSNVNEVINNKILDENKPFFCAEFWGGWFDTFGESHHTRNVNEISKELKSFIDNDASFNFYMFCGGTNFGFMAGSNYNGGLRPTTTSYDYSALLTECGDYTDKYFAVRELLCNHQNLPLLELPKEQEKQLIGEVVFTKSSYLMDCMKDISTIHHSAVPESMEYYGQNYGLIYYETNIVGKYESSELCVSGVKDIAHLFINDNRKLIISRIKNQSSQNSIPIDAIEDELKVGVLVEAFGRINYGEHIIDRKGIDSIYFKWQRFMDYTVYCMPLNNLDKIAFKKIDDTAMRFPVFLKTTFTAKNKNDCFVRFDNLTRGYIFINGFNLGRYWNIGPQRAMYLPGALLKEENEIIILEFENLTNPTIFIDNKPDLGD